MSRRNLKKELLEVGAKESEVSELSNVAKLLGSAQQTSLSATTKESIKGIPGSKEKRSLIPVFAFGGSFAVFMITVVIARSSMPGATLYDLKRNAEDARTLIQPNYVENLVEKRQAELEILKQESAPEDKVRKAEEAHQEALKKYRERSNKNNNQQDRERNNKQNDSNRHNNYYEKGNKSNRQDSQNYNRR